LYLQIITKTVYPTSPPEVYFLLNSFIFLAKERVLFQGFVSRQKRIKQFSAKQID